MAITRGGIVGISLILTTVPALAQTTAVSAEQVATSDSQSLSFGSNRSLIFSAFLGAQVDPAYFGSDELEAGPSFRAALTSLEFLGFQYRSAEFGGDPYARPNGFAYGLSFRYIPGRDSSEYEEINGLDDIDATLELGGGVGYVWPNFEAVADARYGFGGSDAWVGEVRVLYVVRPNDRLALRIGPRLLYGTEKYVDTYFGVTPEESARSGLAAYEPAGGGLVSAGITAIATYRLSDRWWLEGGLKWSHFKGDAEESPIVQDGSSESTEFRIGVRRAFNWRF